MNWYVLILIIPIGIMAIVFYKVFKTKNALPVQQTPIEAQKKFGELNTKIEIGIGIFAFFMAILFGVDLFGPRVEGPGKILDTGLIRNYQVRINGSLPIGFDQQALFLQKRGDRNDYSFVTGSALVKEVITLNTFPLDVRFKETPLLRSVTEVTVEGQRFDVTVGSLHFVGLVAFTFLVFIGLVCNWRVIGRFLKVRKKL